MNEGEGQEATLSHPELFGETFEKAGVQGAKPLPGTLSEGQVIGVSPKNTFFFFFAPPAAREEKWSLGTPQTPAGSSLYPLS